MHGAGVNIEGGGGVVAEDFLADAQVFADREDDGVGQASLDHLDASPDRGSAPEAEHFEIDALTGFAMDEFQVGHAHADAWQIQDGFGRGGLPGRFLAVQIR